MHSHDIELSLLIFLVGVIIIAVIFVQSLLKRLRIPAMVGYIGIGLALRLVDLQLGFLTGTLLHVFEFLAKLGIITLLFQIGLESNVAGLLKQLRSASIIWVLDIAVSGLTGFSVARYILGLDQIQSLFVAVSLTATSVGALSVWQEAHALPSKRGNLLIDIAELDDVSGILLMALLFAVVPILQKGQATAQIPGEVLSAAGVLLLKLLAFGALCLAFSRYAEEHVTGFLRRIAAPPGLMLVVAGAGITMAALAGLLGFSVAIGAFFGGLVFSRDPRSVRIDAAFDPVNALFSPFFFIGIGLSIDPGVLPSAAGVGVILLVAAIMGKLIGDGVPSLAKGGWVSFALIGISMVPRAEITLIIAQQGHQLGNWAVPPEVFSGLIVVSLATATGAPLAVRPLLRKWPQGSEGGT